MPTAIHYVVTLIAWGLSWSAIHLQVATASPDVSILVRFVASAALALAICALRHEARPPARSAWGWLVVQGLCLYCFNFLCFYRAAQLVPSGLIAVVFSCSTLLNAVNGRVFLKQVPPKRLYPAALLGVSGVAALFWPDLLALKDGTLGSGALGFGFALLGTLCFSFGNMASARLQRQGISVFTANAWAMTAGAGVLTVWVLGSGTSLIVPIQGSAALTFWGATAFLVVVATLLGFASYLTLVKRLGAASAAYVTVLCPILALAASTVLENYTWTLASLIGAALALSGNALMVFGGLWQKQQTARHGKSPRQAVSQRLS